MRRRALLLALFFSVSFLLTPTLPAKDKPKTAASHKIPQDFSKFVEIPGAEMAGTEQCAQCHADLSKSFRRSAHSMQEIACEQCHGAGSLHVAAGAYSKEKIISFRDRSAEQANGVCLSCHAKSDHVRNWFSGAHQAQDIKCSDCHTIHGEAHGERRAIESRRQQNENCLRCHQKQNAEADLPYHHPIREAKMSCVDCHDPHGGSAGNNLKLSNTNELCFSCHAEYQGPFTFQHAPVNESCLKCHSAHGSPNQNLLAVSQPALCLQCHSAHHNGASLPLVDRCTNCHNAIHGSDIPSATGGSKFIDK
ncbi:MAG: DmsE family decaheme c-type cytochrome [Terriglobales bacterium]